MWKAIAIVCVLVSGAAADPSHNPPRDPPWCRPSPSRPLVEVDRVKMGTPEQRQKSVIEKGGSIAIYDVAGHALAPGCVPKTDLEQLAADLAKAPWTVTRLPVKCMAFSPIHTEYRYNGKLVWNQRLCSGEELDKESAAVVEAIDHAIDAGAPTRPKLD